MIFSGLLRSIEINKDESPSLYLEYCMIESLLEDIEREYNGDISSLPGGNDKLPIKMSHVFRELIKSYKTSEDEALKSNSRLAGRIPEAEEIAAELQELAKERERRLDFQKAKERELEEYRICNIVPIEREIASLQAKLDGFEQEKENVNTQRRQIVNKISECENDIHNLQTHCDEKTVEYNSNVEKKDRLEREIADVKNKIIEAENTIDLLQTEKHRIENESIQIENNMSSAHARVEEVKQKRNNLEKEINEINNEISIYEDRIEPLLEEKKISSDNLALLTERYNVIDNEVLSLSQQIKELEGKTDSESISKRKVQLQGKREMLELQAAEYEKMLKEIDDCELESRQMSEKIEALRSKQEKVDLKRKEIQLVLDELNSIVENQSADEIDKLCAQYIFLDRIRHGILDTNMQVNSALGGNYNNPVSSRLSLEVKSNFDRIGSILEDYRKLLLEIAKGYSV